MWFPYKLFSVLPKNKFGGFSVLTLGILLGNTSTIHFQKTETKEIPYA